MSSSIVFRRFSPGSWVFLLVLMGGGESAFAQSLEPVKGQRIPASMIGPGVVEEMDVVLARDAERRKLGPSYPRDRGDVQGEWEVPSPRGTYYPRSGRHNIVNKWGDTRMGIGFPSPTDVHGVYVSGQAASGVWTTGLKAVGYRDGAMVVVTEWFENIDESPDYFALQFEGVDRIVFEAKAVIEGAGWYALDDLAFTPVPADPALDAARVVLDFEALPYHASLTGSGYGGLTWEVGTGEFDDLEVVPAPHRPPAPDVPRQGPVATPAKALGGGTSPVLLNDFQGTFQGSGGDFSFPPDTNGAVGPSHYLEVINRSFVVFDRFTGVELMNVALGSFHPGSSGDPRVIYDQFSNRWVVINSDFTTDLLVAVSMTADPTGAWFKTSFTASLDTDSACWPDYPPLGVDAQGIYLTAFFFDGCGPSIFVIDKAPLIDPSPSLGAITAFRNLGTHETIHPVHTYGSPGTQYFISRDNFNTLRLRQITGSMLSPTLTNLGTITIPTVSTAPDAPALESTTDISVIETRLLNAVYRNGSIWTTHDVMSSFGLAAPRWYEVDVATMNLVQSGTVEDPLVHFYYGAIMVNADGDVVMGFSGSNATQYVGAYYTGRRSTDPPGTMALPVQYRAGVASFTRLDGFGRNRWGDYSIVALDPLDDRTFFCLQEYAHATQIWGTHVAKLAFCESPPATDCNGNCIDDAIDVTSGGLSTDCNTNGVPDECDLASLGSSDCNANAVPDECEDCDLNGVADECQLSGIFTNESPVFAPFGASLTPTVHTIVDPPGPLGDVFITFTANATLGGTESVMVKLNGTNLGSGTIFNSGNDCPTESVEVVQMTVAQFLSQTGGGDAIISMQTFDFLDTDCGGATSIRVEVSYDANLLLDTNSNGLLDVCECVEDCAGAPDGNVGIDEFLAVLANWGTAVSCDFAPAGGDGVIGIDEFLGVLANWGPCFSP